MVTVAPTGLLDNRKVTRLGRTSSGFGDGSGDGALASFGTAFGAFFSGTETTSGVFVSTVPLDSASVGTAAGSFWSNATHPPMGQCGGDGKRCNPLLNRRQPLVHPDANECRSCRQP